jgi:magnesium transporter
VQGDGEIVHGTAANGYQVDLHWWMIFRGASCRPSYRQTVTSISIYQRHAIQQDERHIFGPTYTALMSHRTSKVGLGPGALVYVGKQRSEKVRIRLLHYTTDSFSESDIEQPTDLRNAIPSDGITWVDVDGVHDTSVIAGIGELLGVHFLLLEDIMNTTSRPKVEIGKDHIFVSVKSIEFGESPEQAHHEQFSMLIAGNLIVTFQEEPGDPFDPVRERIRHSRGIVRSRNAEYLGYLLLDVIVDNYIAVSAGFADQIDLLESAVLRRPSELTLHRILNLRKELLAFKRSIDPLRDVTNVLQVEVDKSVSKYYRDLSDHILAETENLSVYREMMTTLLDLYHSSLSYRTNAVMKVLTIITTIFVPLTFIAGVYGMNFQHMPELSWKYGYFAVLGIMGLLMLGMLIFFRRRKWL